MPSRLLSAVSSVFTVAFRYSNARKSQKDEKPD
jgi:hypothetical protein